MQVRHKHSTDTHRRGAPRRRSALRRDGAVAPVPVAVDHLADEHRLRDSGGPDDRALYRCGCGTAFRADVSASVSCPQCGGDQAW
jgi:hypothetical protein